MKRLFACALLALSSVAFGATTVPIQLITPIAANTVVTNATGSTATPTAFVMPSCSTSTSALQWTSGTGFVCNTAINAATLGGATFSSPGAIGNTTPGSGTFGLLTSIANFTPQVGIVGTTAGGNAPAGNIGELLSNTTTGTALTTAVSANATSVSLTAGDWDVMGTLTCVPAGSTVINYCAAGINTVSATIPAAQGSSAQIPGSTLAGLAVIMTTPIVRVNLTTTTTVFLVANSGFTTSTLTASGFIRARRVR